jgi:hypothetical protein
MMHRFFMLPFLCLGIACGESSTDEGAGVVGGIDTSSKGIQTFVTDRGHANWTAEPAVHESAGPHGKVRVFFNDSLKGALASNAATHPVGSAAVKELYESDGTTLDGYAVMVKIAEGSAKESWIWWEGFTPELEGSAYGRGIGGCDGCHSQGKDKVVSRLP